MESLVRSNGFNFLISNFPFLSSNISQHGIRSLRIKFNQVCKKLFQVFYALDLASWCPVRCLSVVFSGSCLALWSPWYGWESWSLCFAFRWSVACVPPVLVCLIFLLMSLVSYGLWLDLLLDISYTIIFILWILLSFTICRFTNSVYSTTESKFFPFRVDLFLERRQDSFKRIASIESVSIPT